MSVENGRQSDPNNIRQDHIERYKFAASRVSGHVADLGCGIGYGSRILVNGNADTVDAFDIDPDAIRAAPSNGRIRYCVTDLDRFSIKNHYDHAVAFEVIEHLADPRPMLKGIDAPNLICSVPNELVISFDPVRHKYHHRHYTARDFASMLGQCGWKIAEWRGQVGKESPVEYHPDMDRTCMTIIAVCSR